jgi:predicted TIM-barrel fold metal-dependent hydrolase
MNASEKLSAPLRGAEHYNQIDPSTNVRKTLDTTKSAMEFVIGEVGAERIMIGSDYCFDMGYERPVHFLDQVNLTSVQRKMILGDNAARMLKL